MPASWSPRVWLSVVLGIFLQPFVFLYVNRPGLFWLYLVASLVCAGVDWYFGWALTLLFSLLPACVQPHIPCCSERKRERLSLL